MRSRQRSIATTVIGFLALESCSNLEPHSILVKEKHWEENVGKKIRAPPTRAQSRSAAFHLGLLWRGCQAHGATWLKQLNRRAASLKTEANHPFPSASPAIP